MSRFKDHSLAVAIQKLQTELDRLGATEQILSTNLQLRLDGLPKSGQAQPTDKGVAVYFKWKKRDVVLACDRWNRVECNVWAVASHIETLRSQERWGVGNIEQAFRGYLALPVTTGGVDWWKVLGVAVNAGAEQVKAAYREKAKTSHPDAGGSVEEFQALQLAYKMGLDATGGKE